MSILPLTSDSLAQRRSDVWSYLSPSRLNLWLRCPLAFKLRYKDGIVSPVSRAQSIGKLVHTGLEHYYRHRQLGITLEVADLGGRLNTIWDCLPEGELGGFADTADETSARAQATALTRAYLAQLPADEPRPLAVEAALEAPLVDPTTGEDLGIPLLGVVDLVLPEPSGSLVVDFKTAARSSDALEITHEIQLSCYAHLFRQVTGQTESGLEIRSLIKTKTPRVETQRYATRHDGHFRRLFAVIRAYLEDLDRGRFVYRPGFACGSCEHRSTHCRDWSG